MLNNKLKADLRLSMCTLCTVGNIHNTTDFGTAMLAIRVLELMPSLTTGHGRTEM